jgi:hypothetical protein
MLPDTDDAAIQADAYIDGLLTGHKRSPVALPRTDYATTAPTMRRAIDLLEHGLPRFHPSFLFEEWLAGQLRRAAREGSSDGSPTTSSSEIGVVQLGLAPRPPYGPTRLGDHRLLVGGAIASGVSIGAAMIAWRRKRD